MALASTERTTCRPCCGHVPSLARAIEPDSAVPRASWLSSVCLVVGRRRATRPLGNNHSETSARQTFSQVLHVYILRICGTSPPGPTQLPSRTAISTKIGPFESPD
ncbi:hypothetical protein CONLIGDRAFT_282115 [Coniochaeta ligniaria NRRL 30616]|uniref:Uncharacterized protein n=1 Tax=Coniochaeta ligniaria NRRL 30616 TaxID=1408157 RepID=A0A1J7IS96_9PEZI|nr:hypothetical protein CONLIGDRAFT_282115 [Coniochaeta ligniaria NRRL 30616]